MSDAPDDLVVADLDSPVGRVSVGVTRVGLVELGWGPAEEIAVRLGLPVADDDRVEPVLRELGEYFDGARESFEAPLDWRQTTPPGQTVLRTLHETVGYGQSVTYGELATRSGTGIPARGIGAIMGSNPLPIVVPCHRVVAHNGLGGYSGGGRHGPEVKRWLLALEGVLPRTLDSA